MLGTSHLLFGAAIGVVIPNPYIAFPVGWASHYLMDALPHVDPGNFRNPAIAPKMGRDLEGWEMIFAGVDMLIGVTALFLVWNLRDRSPAVLWGAIGCITPDLLDNVPWWNKLVWRNPYLHRLALMHKTLHFPSYLDKRKWWGLVAPLVFLVISLGWLLA